MRLIDADLLKKNISKRLKSFNPDGTEIEVADALVSTMMEIDNQPTAFDVDKIIEQLEKEESKARLQQKQLLNIQARVGWMHIKKH